ncbi:MAG TPA: RluA family pseudouridine synthase [Chthonomonadales bacterium]|nr:RluA family pseudouridine synthase [Chthonomonadales bacterium]
MEKWTVKAHHKDTRVDVFLAGVMGISRSEAQRLLETGAAKVNGEMAKPGRKLHAGDRVEVERPAPIPAQIASEEIPLAVVYEDADLLVIDKPRGMVVHPAPGRWSGTLVNAVLAHINELSGVGGELRPGIVHRLDKDTSGLLVIAKNDAAHHALQAQIQAKTAERIYEALMWGVPRFEQATIDAPIGRHPRDRKKMAVIMDPRFTARPAVTELKVLEPLRAFSRVEARLKTGRTHQIRVHCAYIGHPVVGDPVYGGMRKVPAESLTPQERKLVEDAIAALGGQALHARTLAFDHPHTGQRMVFSSPLPEEMQELLDVLRNVYA